MPQAVVTVLLSFALVVVVYQQDTAAADLVGMVAAAAHTLFVTDLGGEDAEHK